MSRYSSAVPDPATVQRWLAAPLLADWDAVHVTWSGWLATEGRILDLGDGAVSVVAEQRGEHTNSLRPGLVEPRLLLELDSEDLCPDFP
jgi:hypothetical protein